jgi:hypothetical protein
MATGWEHRNRFEFLEALLKFVRNVLQKDEAEYNVFVFGLIHIASKDICRRPDFLLKAYGGCTV